MKTVLAALLFAASALAQSNTAPAPAQGACGPLNVDFDAEASSSRAVAQPQAGKAIVYVVEDFRKAPGELGNPTIRVGLDGAWMGAMRANSYLFFLVDPGEHHLCTSWQSRLKRLSRLAAFAHFATQPGETYYFRARITYSTYGHGTANMNLDLDRLDPDEGQFLVTTFRLSDSHPRK